MLVLLRTLAASLIFTFGIIAAVGITSEAKTKSVTKKTTTDKKRMPREKPSSSTKKINSNYKHIPRKIAVLWDSSEYSRKDYVHSRPHKKLEVVLNHLGFIAEYFDIHADAGIRRYKSNLGQEYIAIVSWFTDVGITNPKEHLAWLQKQTQKGIKYVQLGEIGYAENETGRPTSLAAINNFLGSIGLQYTGEYFENPLLFELQFKTDKKLLEFERTLKGELFGLHGISKKSDNGNAWLSVTIKGTQKHYDAVIVNNKGGFVQPGFSMYTSDEIGTTRWRINPFEFFRQALHGPSGLSLTPVPDTTTLCGRRIYYSHIDGDGFINISDIDRKSLSAKIIFDEILAKKKLPVSVSHIVAEIFPQYLGSAESLALAREIAAQPYVETASHTYTHPLSWEKNPSEQEIEIYQSVLKDKKLTGAILAYDIGFKDLSYARETIQSLEYLQKELKPARDARLLQWSGSCRPPAEALRLLEKQEYLNINGGDSRFDSEFSSYSHLSALYRKVSGFTQVYASASNENLFTNLWAGPFGGFSWVVDFFKNTESPIRIKPINVYYHFYSGEKRASLEALKLVYKWLEQQKITPMFTSDYARLVRDFTRVEIVQASPTEFSIKNNGKIRTLRIDNSSHLPDYEKSKNILGHYVHGGSMYIHLGSAPETRLVVTTDQPKRPFISSCNAIVDDIIVTEKKITIKGRSYTKPEVNLENTGYRKVEVKINAEI